MCRVELLHRAGRLDSPIHRSSHAAHAPVVPPFAGADENHVKAELKAAGFPEDGKIQLRDGRTGDKFAQKTANQYTTS